MSALTDLIEQVNDQGLRERLLEGVTAWKAKEIWPGF